MQVVCGQCGSLHQLPASPAETAYRCPTCGHAVNLQFLTFAPASEPWDPETLFADLPAGFANQASKALRERVLVVCGNCNGKMKVGKRLAGKKVKCPNCSSAIRIPYLDEEEQFDLAMLASASRTEREGEEKEEILELTEDDYEMTEDVLIGTKFFKLTRRRLLLFVGIYVVSMVLIVAGVWFRGEKAPQDDVPDAPGVAMDDGGDSAAKNSQRACSFLSGKRDAFASGGYWPAPAGKPYFKAEIALRAGAEPVSLKTYGSSITLNFPEGVFPSLGEVYTEAHGPLRARRRTIRLKAGEEKKLTLLFSAPNQSSTGKLHIEGIGEAPVSISRPKTSGEKLPGNYTETPPRNLRPLSRNPIAAALQSAQNQTLRIQSRAGEYQVSIPQASLYGQASIRGEGVCDLTFRKGKHTLKCTLWILPDGQRVVLYLDDAPMNQITYRRENAQSSTSAAKTPARQ